MLYLQRKVNFIYDPKIILIILVFIFILILLLIYLSYKKLVLKKKKNNSIYKPINSSALSKRKVNNNLNLDIVFEFLNQSDYFYIEAFVKKNITNFKKYASPQVIDELKKFMKYNILEFGLPQHRSVKWDLINYDGNYIFLKKEVKFIKSFNIGDKSLKLGEERNEFWKVSVVDNKNNIFIIEEILRG